MFVEQPVSSPPRREPRPARSVYFIALILLALCSNGLLGLSLIGLLQPSTAIDYVKIAMLVIAGAIVTGTVNHLAVERGTRLFIVGYVGVGLAMLTAVVFVGTGLASATFAGLVRGDVDKLMLAEHGRALSDATAKASAISPVVARATPLVRSAASDLAQKADCERRSSCVSGRPQGGRGPVARHLQMLATRGEAVAAELEAAQRTSVDQSGRTSALVAEYMSVASGSLDLREKRVALQELDARIREGFFGRVATGSAPLAQAYLGELKAPVAIAGQPEASRAIAAILKGHADSLDGTLRQTQKDELALPAFPAPPGIADAVGHGLRFWPILVLALVVDVVLPLLLWLSVYATKDWSRHQGRRAPPRPVSEDQRETERILAVHRPAIHPAFDPEAYFPSLPRRERRRDDAWEDVRDAR